ncbi:LmeA family phospholipid-binding protein [Streptomyces antibioticus]|uniref:LmeA family phospholipid-binding protein n=1 Tax=Streptomyces antibioticus TaxID=1890 RepID=UPI0036F82DB9
MNPYHHDGSFGHWPEPGDDLAPVNPPPRRMRRRAVTVAAVCLVTVAATAGIVDRIAASRVESRTAEAFQQGMRTPERPSVTVRGFPVLPQLASGTLRHVDITAQDIPACGTSRPLPVTRLTVGLDQLRTSGEADQAHARAVDATAFLSFEAVSDALGLEIAEDGEPGRIRAQLVLPFSGEVTVSAAVSAVSANRIAFTDVSITQGDLPAAGRALLNRVLAEPIHLRNIPDGLHLRSVTSTPSGLNAHFTGEQVTFRPGTSSADSPDTRSSCTAR